MEWFIFFFYSEFTFSSQYNIVIVLLRPLFIYHCISQSLVFFGCTTSWLVNPLPVVLTTCNIGLLIFSLSIFYSVDMDVIQRERGSNENKIKTYMYTVYNKQFSHWGIQHRNLVKWVLKR